MKLAEHLYLIGGGMMGLSDPTDCYIYMVDGGSEVALVDSGSGIDLEPVFQRIRKLGFKLKDIGKVILTHVHADHAAGAKKIKLETSCKVLAPSVEKRLIEEGDDEELGLTVAKKSGYYPENYTYTHCDVDETFKDGDKIRVGQMSLLAIHTPGHSKGSTCFLLEYENYRVLFSGDTVFYGGEIGLLNCRGSDLADYRENIHKLEMLSVDALLPGHKIIVLKNGQKHIDYAIAAFQKLSVPPSFI